MEMPTFSSRLHSFYNVQRRGNIKFYVPRFPNKSIKISDLAKAGFVYEGDGDYVRCAWCRVRFGEWESEDNPLHLHGITMPNCPFIRRL